MKKLASTFTLLFISNSVWADRYVDYDYDESYGGGGGSGGSLLESLLVTVVIIGVIYGIWWSWNKWHSLSVDSKNKHIENTKNIAIVIVVLFVGTFISMVFVDKPNQNTTFEPTTVQPVVERTFGLDDKVVTQGVNDEKPREDYAQPQIQAPIQPIEQPALNPTTVNKVTKPRRTSEADEVAAEPPQQTQVPQPMSDAANNHYNTIYAVHPDADAIVESSEFAEFITQQPDQTQRDYRWVLKNGSTKQVIDLLNQYKQATTGKVYRRIR